MAKQYTNEEIGAMKLVGYERTREDAMELKRVWEQETGKKCVVIGSGRRARKGTYDTPWQVRELPTKDVSGKCLQAIKELKHYCEGVDFKNPDSPFPDSLIDKLEETFRAAGLEN